MKKLNETQIGAIKLLSKMLICFIILFLFTGCATKVRTVYKSRPIKSSKVMHLECIKDLLVHDVTSNKANEICVSVFRVDYER